MGGKASLQHELLHPYSIVLGLRAIIIKDIFLTDQNVIKAKCSNVVFFSVL